MAFMLPQQTHGGTYEAARALRGVFRRIFAPARFARRARSNACYILGAYTCACQTFESVHLFVQRLHPS